MLRFKIFDYYKNVVEQAVGRFEREFVFGRFAYSPVNILYGVGGVDHSSDIRREGNIGKEVINDFLVKVFGEIVAILPLSKKGGELVFGSGDSVGGLEVVICKFTSRCPHLRPFERTALVF